MFTGKPEHIKGFDYLGPHMLRSEEAAISVARYILENPVRAGLVARIDEYEFSGSSVYSLDQILDAVQLREKWYRSPAEAGHYTYTRVARNSSSRVSRARVRSGPSQASSSNKPGLIVRPLTATRVA
jgi:hypothetical protein